MNDENTEGIPICLQHKAFEIQARRRNKPEEWTTWTGADDYTSAVAHVENVKKYGFEGRILNTKTGEVVKT